MEWLNKLLGRTTPGVAARVPLSIEALQAATPGMPFMREWVCGGACAGEDQEPSTLRIRCREDRGEGPSNYAVYPETYPDVKLRGHSMIPAEHLNWNGLAEERGWIVDPVVRCPACVRGMSRDAYKVARRNGYL